MLSFPSANLARVLLAILVVLIACGCRGTKKDQFELPGQTQLLIEKFRIRGVNSVPLAELKSGLATQENTWLSAGSVRWLPFIGQERQYFNEVNWAQDLNRIKTFYYARGYFDASISSQNIVENPEEGTLSITITISEGEPTRVGSIKIDGVQRMELQQDLLADISLKKGEVFTEQAYIRSRRQMRKELERAGYAYAEVEGRVVVEAQQREASVVFYVDSGPLSEFGDVSITGMDEISERAIREALTFEAGDRFSPEAMQETQERIYDLGVFSVVKVSAQTQRPEEEDTPEPDANEGEGEGEEMMGGLGDLLDGAQEAAEERAELDPVVPVTIQVQEAKLWNVRVGAGVAAEIARQEVHGRLDWTSRNFLGGLRKLEHFNSAGYAWAPSVFVGTEQRNEGVIVDSELRFTQPRFIERFTTFESRLRFQRDVEQGYNLTSPTAKLGVKRKFFRFLTAELSYNFALYLLTGIDAALLDPSLRLQPEYILEYFEQRVAFNFLNDFFNPTRGAFVELKMQEASAYLGRLPGVPTGGHFDFLAPSVGVEYYVPMWSHVLALRSKAASIYNLGEKLPPIPQRLYAGGADSMRAFGRERLSLYSVSQEAIAIGGFSKFEASIEPRFRVVQSLSGLGSFWVAPFFDAATVLPGALFVTGPNNEAPAESFQTIANSLLYGVGAGAWWVTPIGPVRIDVAYRLSELTEDQRFRRCVAEPNVAGTCNGVFVVENADPVAQQVRSPWNVIIGIGHSF